MNDFHDDRPLGPAVLRGLRRLCPACGEGHLMTGYLSVAPACPVCGAEMHHHRADDGPAYLTILITGHLMAPVMLAAFTLWRPDPLIFASILTVGCVGLALWMLPRLKGMLVGIQWSRRMHGFETDGDDG